MVATFLFYRQVQIGMLVFALLFMPWNRKRPHFIPRFITGISAYIILSEVILRLKMYMTPELLLYTFLIFGIIWLCFDCSVIHNIFYTTCAYSVQFISSKFSYTFFALLSRDRKDYIFALQLLFASTFLAGLVIYNKYTKKYSKKFSIQFDNVKTVLYSAIFLTVAIHLSVVLEKVIGLNDEYYVKFYASLNSLYVLFGFIILVLEFSSFSNTELEKENRILSDIIESDKEQYEQVRKDMEKINIRYHDLKQLYLNAGEEERSKLELEMEELNLSYFTGNKAVDVTLTKKAGICQRKGIQLVCSVDTECLGGIKHFHIYTMLGNALDNAIECLEKVTESEKKTIFLNFHKEKNMAVIKVENYTPIDPFEGKKKIVTTKSNKTDHGFGIKSIKNTAEICGGCANTFVENNIFYLLISIPLK